MWLFDGFLKKKSKKYTSTYKFPSEIQDFFDALRDCHLGNRAEYFAKLKKLAGVYPEEPVFWLFAGDILRDNNPEKALELHRDVLLRSGTSGVLRSIALEHVAKDYIALKQNRKAVSVLKDAVKCADYASAALLLSEVYETEGDFDSGLEAVKKYMALTDAKSDLVLQRFCARALNYHFKSFREDKNRALKWISVFSKKCGDGNQALAADYLTCLIGGNTKKSTDHLRKIVESGGPYEILARSLLLDFQNGSEVNYAVEGLYKEIFHLLFNENLKYEEKSGDAAAGTLVSHKLMLRNSLDGDFRILNTAIPDRTLFVCSECGRNFTEILPVCPACQKITGRNFKINQEV